MRARANSQDSISKIKDRYSLSLFRIRRNKLQRISKQNLRIYDRICNQKSKILSENTSKKKKSNQQNQHKSMYKNDSNIKQNIKHMTCRTNFTRRQSCFNNCQKQIIQQPNLYSLPQFSKQYYSINLFNKFRNKEEQQTYLKQQNQRVEQTWNRFKNKNKLRGLFNII